MSLIVAAFGCACSDVGPGAADRAAVPTPMLLSVDGVNFRIDAPEALVFAPTFADEYAPQAATPRIATAFTLCAHMPELVLTVDKGSAASCREIGWSPSPWLMLGVERYRMVSPLPEVALHERFSERLSRLARLPGADLSRLSADDEAYVAAADQYGLHVFTPTGPNVRPSSTTLFWAGADAAHVRTFIECRGYLPTQSGKWRDCTHRFMWYLPEDGGHMFEIVLDYHSDWLGQWQSIEVRVRGILKALRADGTPTGK